MHQTDQSSAPIENVTGADLAATGREMAERRSLNLGALESNLNILSGADNR